MSITPRRHVAVGLLCRAAGLGLGVVADRIVPDPQTHHPVAAFGTAVARLEKTMYADSVRRGTLFTATCLTPLAVIGGTIDRLTQRRPVLRIATTALATWAVVGSASLAREGRAMADHLANDDLAAARKRLPNLCGRAPDALDAAEIARGTVESMAENTSDAAVASLWWGAIAGLPGLLVHRGANTLDAMIGHHNDRYERFGKVAAHFDDIVNWVPARLTGALAAVCAPTVGGDRATTWRMVRAEHSHHPSPNGGWCESAWAAALGVQLGGRNVYYGNRVEFRPLLGSGPRPDADKTADAARLVTTVTTTATWCAITGLASVAHLLFHGGVIPRNLLPRSQARR
ncbi:cobalamin biosynthesis protein [Cutibacterium sp. WCA-380-WT-3A]|uniref:Cobalamin biosynthesis protein CobD n=1 Tax=Cutibacterium porci TaxID=2605781 RepID=A0A7K0J576_9ACTN|nr:cobalamin biosynthesis protein [Cutibacterium porci]MSS45089.1 cobalamin biosynthesis protein [Cutibacterium porci]